VIRLLSLISETIKQTHTIMIDSLLHLIPINLSKNQQLCKKMCGSAMHHQVYVTELSKLLLKNQNSNYLLFSFFAGD
jgi:hypothetical protein